MSTQNNRAGARRQRSLLAALRHHGAADIYREARALCIRAWPLYGHYAWPSATAHFAHAVDLASPGDDVAAIVAEHSDFLYEVEETTRWQNDGLAITVLPDESVDPGSAFGLPDVLARAQALTAALPALVIGLLDDAVDEAMRNRSDGVAMLGGIGVLMARYRDAYIVEEPSMPKALGALLEPRRPLLLELTDQWTHAVQVTIGDDTEHAPLQCFTSLDEAKRYAVLQHDWSRAISPGPRDDRFMGEIAAIAACDERGIRVLCGDTRMRTHIVPRTLPGGLTAIDPDGPIAIPQ